MNNKFLHDYIPTEYYQDLKGKVKDSVINEIQNISINNHDDLDKALLKLVNEVKDEELKQEIIDNVHRFVEEIDSLKESDGNVIYQIITEKNDVDFPYGYAKDFDNAFSMGLLSKLKFQIIKNKMIDSVNPFVGVDDYDYFESKEDSKLSDEDDKYGSVLGMLSYTENGVLQWYWAK